MPGTTGGAGRRAGRRARLRRGGLVTAVSAATVRPVPTTERRLSAVAATSRKYVVSVVLGAGVEQASPQRRWQVTALRLPWVRPVIGSRGRLGRGVIGGTFRESGVVGRTDSADPARRAEDRQVDVG